MCTFAPTASQGRGLGENVSDLSISRDANEVNQFWCLKFADEEELHIDVFDMPMVINILDKLNSNLIFTINCNGQRRSNAQAMTETS